MKVKSVLIEMTIPELRAIGKLLGALPTGIESTIGITGDEIALLDAMFYEMDEILKISEDGKGVNNDQG